MNSVRSSASSIGGPSSPLTEEAFEAFSDVLFDVAFEPAFANFEVGVFLSPLASAAAARFACRAAFDAETGMMAKRKCVCGRRRWKCGGGVRNVQNQILKNAWAEFEALNFPTRPDPLCPRHADTGGDFISDFFQPKYRPSLSLSRSFTTLGEYKLS
jgi:hypothetical protein